MQNGKINNKTVTTKYEHSYVTSADLGWMSMETSLPPAMTEVLLFIPDPETGLGYVRVGYYDPDQDRIAIASIPINTNNTDLLGIMDKISQNNASCPGATHWKMIGEFPKTSEYVAARTASMVIAQMTIVDNM